MTATHSSGWDGWFEDAPGYLNTASIGLPPTAAVDEVIGCLEGWRRGQVQAPGFDGYVTRARESWARIAGVPADCTAIGSTVSELVGLVAASLPEGSRVLVARGDFTSVLFPFLAQQERGRVTVTDVELDDLVAATDRDAPDLVAVSSVQSADGRRADVTALLAGAGQAGTRVLLDVTQSCGWLPLDCSGADFVVCAGYKWLLCPRGVAFLSVRPALLDSLTPTSAGWYAGASIWDSIYGLPLRLAPDARRLDVSPAWFSWVGAALTLEMLAALDPEQVRAHDVGLADQLLAGLGLPSAGSAIVSLSADGAAERLAAAGVNASVRAGRARLSFHLHNGPADVERALGALRP